MRRLVTAAIIASLAVGTAHASDFSKLGDPSFARSLLISHQRRTEVQCAATARANAALKRGWTTADAEAFAAPIVARLAIETGVEEETASGNANTTNVAIDFDYLSAEEKKEKLELLDFMTGQCKPLFDVFRSGGAAALEPKLQPATGLIPLLTVPYCLAVMRQPTGQPYAPLFAKRDIAEIEKQARSLLDPAGQAELDRAVAEETAKFKSSKEPSPLVEQHQLACLATVRTLYSER